MAVYNDEELAIESKLATLVPESVHDVFCLLKFAADTVQ
jgi:hypothetical protein